MPNTTNLILPYPATGDNPAANVLAALTDALDDQSGQWLDYTITVTQGVGITFTKNSAGYRVLGKMCEWAFMLTPTSAGTAANPVDILLPPVVPKYTTTVMPRGIIDIGSGITQQTLEQKSGSTTLARIQAFGGDYTTQITIGLRLAAWGQYEVA